MSYSPTVFLFPDASVLVTLANQEKLDVLFEPKWTLVLIDSVVNEVIRTASPCAEVLGKWLRRNNLPVVQTRAHERAQKAIRMGLSISQQMRMQDLGIQEVMNELALDCGGRVGVFLLEEHRFMSSSFMEPLNCKKFTLRAFQTFLEQRHEAVQAARTVEAGESAKQLAVETPETPSAAIQPTKEEVAAYQTEATRHTEGQVKEPDFSGEVEDVLVAPHAAAVESEEPPLAWLDSKKSVIQPKPSHSPAAKSPQHQGKLGFITGAAIQLLGRKRAEAVEAAFSKIKEGALRLTDSSKNAQTKTKPASIAPVTRQKLVDPQQNGEEQPTAPPKPVAKFRPNTGVAGPQTEPKDEPRSVTLQKLLEEHAAARKLAANKAAAANANVQAPLAKELAPDTGVSSQVSASAPLENKNLEQSSATKKSNKADKKRGPSKAASALEPDAKVESQADARQGSLLGDDIPTLSSPQPDALNPKTTGAKGKAKLKTSAKQVIKQKGKSRVKAESVKENNSAPAFLSKKDNQKADTKPEHSSKMKVDLVDDHPSETQLVSARDVNTSTPPHVEQPAAATDQAKALVMVEDTVPAASGSQSSVGVGQSMVEASVQPQEVSTQEASVKTSADPKLAKDFKNLMA